MALSGIGNAVSAMRAFGTAMSSTANNIANAQSQGYKKTMAVIEQAGNDQGVTVSISRDASQGYVDDQGNELSNVDIAREITSTIATEAGFKANVASVRTMDEMVGSLLDIKG
ncbi:MAG: flagellar basal body rod C-terminal domain-containing protein [Pseudomonadota bacterium]